MSAAPSFFGGVTYPNTRNTTLPTPSVVFKGKVTTYLTGFLSGSMLDAVFKDISGLRMLDRIEPLLTQCLSSNCFL